MGATESRLVTERHGRPKTAKRVVKVNHKIRLGYDDPGYSEGDMHQVIVTPYEVKPIMTKHAAPVGAMSKRTVVRETVTTRDGVRTVTREEVTEDGGKTTTTRTVTSGDNSNGASSGFGRSDFGRDDDFDKRFRDMKLRQGFGDDDGFEQKKSSGGGGGMKSLFGGKSKDSDDKKPAKKISNSDFVKQAVDAHNKHRKKHQVKELKEAKDLTAYAQEWADHLAATNSFGHSKCTLKGDRLGENCATKWSSEGPDGYTGHDAVKQWYDEEPKYDYSGRYNSSGGTGHFTQVVWKGSKEVGIGRAIGRDGRVLVVGSYRPAGNMMGDFAANVFPPK